MKRRDPGKARGSGEPPPEVDLHRLSRAQAERTLARELHSARVRGDRQLLVITGRGFGNPQQQPVLRKHIEGWLRGPEGHRYGVVSFQVASRGGALRLRLG